MLKQLAYVGFISAACAAAPALAQTNTDQTPDKMTPAASAPAAAAPATPSPDASAGNKMTPPPASAAATPEKANGDTFVTQQAMNQWRASKLAGVNVYGPDQKKVGSIKDILMDHDGNAKVIVVGVGGFLGIGAKDVGVPFDAMQWQTETRAAATNPPPASTTGTGTGMSAGQGAMKTDPAAVEASQGYPDRGVLNMTEAQLKAAPEFHYAEATTTSAGAAGTNATKP
jgi:sporulation protein YlmC with PRC-barrel domain